MLIRFNHRANHRAGTPPLRPLHTLTQAGFTLIELLIALGVMAVFALLAYRGLDSVLRLQSGAQAHEARALAIDRVITQLEADLRQASTVIVLSPKDGATASVNANTTADKSGLHLRISRRVDSALAQVDWYLENQNLTRRTQTSAGTQTAVMLTAVTASDWQFYEVQWRTIGTAQIIAQATQQLPLTRAAGIRLTVQGKTINKYFLIGR